MGGAGSDQANAIAVDSSGNAYLAGYSYSTNFPITSGAYQTTNKGSNDAFVTKLSADGKSLLYSTFLGGAGVDAGNAIAVDSSGNAYMAGYTQSTNFPTTSGAYQATNKGGKDVFITRLSADGKSLIYSTYLGGGGNDVANAFAVDSSGNAYVAGQT